MDDTELQRLLAGGDRRSVGNTEKAVSEIRDSPTGIGAAVRLMRNADPIVAMRAADALEKVTRSNADLLVPHKGELLGDIARNPQQEIRWHLLQMLSRLRLTPAERAVAFAIAVDSLDHRSRIVVADALSAMFALSADDAALRRQAENYANRHQSSPSAAVRSRAKRLLSGR